MCGECDIQRFLIFFIFDSENVFRHFNYWDNKTLYDAILLHRGSDLCLTSKELWKLCYPQRSVHKTIKFEKYIHNSTTSSQSVTRATRKSGPCDTSNQSVTRATLTSGPCDILAAGGGISLTGTVEQHALDLQECFRPGVVPDIHRHQALGVVGGPADEERHHYGHWKRRKTHRE